MAPDFDGWRGSYDSWRLASPPDEGRPCSECGEREEDDADGICSDCRERHAENAADHIPEHLDRREDD